jgi:HupE / UreJ protein
VWSGAWLAVLRGMLIACLLGSAASGHDIPADVRINAFVRPAGQKLELVVRVPLLAMQEVDFPRRGPGYLDVSRADEALRNAAKLWLIGQIDLFEDGVRLGNPTIAQARVSLPSDRSFASYEQARAHLDGPRLSDDLDLYWNQQMLDVLIEYPIRSDRSAFAIHPRVDRFGETVSTALRFLPPEGGVRAFEFHGDPGLVQLDPRWHQAAFGFLKEGFWHILGGVDHLLFLVCLVAPFRRLRPLVVIVTSFTAAHSIALIAAASGFVPDALWFTPLVEALIAATIVYMALENIVGGTMQVRWMVAFAFGIVHGFGFSFLLREQLQFAGDHLVTSLVAFNLGVELGQLAVLLVLVPLLDRLFRHVVPERIGIILLSAFVAHTGWHWMLERGEQVLQFPFPTLDAAFLASVMRGLMAAIVLAVGVLAANGLLRRWLRVEKPVPGE